MNKMLKSKYILNAIVILSLFLGGCKYDDGPAISFITKKERVSNIWKPVYFEDNHPEATGYPVRLEDFYKFKLIITLTKSGDAELKYFSEQEEKVKYEFGTWTFQNKNRVLFFNWKDKIEVLPVVFESYPAWNIKMLREDELQLETNDGRFRIHLTPYSG